MIYNIYCDETWNREARQKNFFVIYGVMIENSELQGYLDSVKEFRKRRGLQGEVKWEKVGEEWKDAKKNSRKNRYEDYLDIFFDFLKRKKSRLGVCFLK